MDLHEFRQRYETVPVEESPNRVRDAVPEPVLSVHVLTYNHAPYIRQALDSVLMQETEFPIEIVLGDDDSSDGTREICLEYAEAHPETIRLMLHHRENNIPLRGKPTHLFQYWRNMFALRGTYYAILAGDDYWTDPHKLQKQVDALQTDDTLALTFHECRVVDGNGDPVESSTVPDEDKRVFDRYKLSRRPGLPAKAHTYVGINVFDEIPEAALSIINEDSLTVSMVNTHGRARFLSSVTPAVYRQHEGGVWSMAAGIDRMEHLLVTHRHLRTMFGGTDAYRETMYWCYRHLRDAYRFAGRPGDYLRTSLAHARERWNGGYRRMAAGILRTAAIDLLRGLPNGRPTPPENATSSSLPDPQL